MFELFVNGKTIEDIRKAYQSFSLGQVAHAAVIGEWHKLKDQHVESLLDNVVQRVQQTSLESISYVCDWISTHHKLHGEAMVRFFQSGNKDDLKDTPASLRQYAEGVQLLRSLTGQDKQKTDLPPYRVAPGVPQRADGAGTSIPMTRPAQMDQNTHSRILDALDVEPGPKKD